MPFWPEAWKKTLARRSSWPQCIGCFTLAGRTTRDVEHLRRDTHATCDKMPTTLPALCLVTLVLCNVHGSLEHEIPRRSFLSRRAIDGTRGRKYFDPEEEGAFDSYGSAGGQYDPYQEKTDFSDIRRNVPGEPGVDYPAYTTLPQTGFTCERRSRGYYADEVAGCQVFHVCHDVLVSSFLCPIGSVFSQKLLTCDWWTKVDCSSSSKYIDVNRNSYQQDDDEMIRNAYAMISLQSGTDVTKDGLVDPDRTGSVVDYQKNPGRILDYSSVDTTGNDLRTNFEDYPKPASRDFLPPYRLKDEKPETGRSYQEKYYSSDKSRSPYQDSPIIRVQKINDPAYGVHQKSKDFQESFQRPNEFTNQFQPSYAPTVPTVTTTTRRFYSPTVPTTFRPSTLAYNKLDQVIDSSDYYFSHSRSNSFVTPPTRVFSSDNKGRQDLGVAQRKPEASLSRKLNRDDDYSRQESYEDDYEDDNSEEARNERLRERFQVRVADDFNYNRTAALNERSSPFDELYREFGRNRGNEETVDDFETRGSIGLGQALHQSFRGISVRKQNPVKGETKASEIDSRKEEIKHTLVRPQSTDYTEERDEETTEQYQRNDQRDTKTRKEEAPDDESTFVSSTTPSVIESTIKASTSLRESLNSSVINDGPGDSKNSTDANSDFFNGKDSVESVDNDFQTIRPNKFVKPLQKAPSKFQIKVPDLTEVSTLLIRYTTLSDGHYSKTGTTEIPRYQSTYSDDYVDQPTSFDEKLGVTSNYETVKPSKDTNFQNYPSTVVKTSVSSSFSEKFDTNGPSKDYTDSFDDFSEPGKLESSTDRSEFSSEPKNDTERKIVSNRIGGLQFTAADVVQSFKTTAVDIGTVSTVSASSTVSTPKIIKTTSPPESPKSPEIASTVKTFEKSFSQQSNRSSTPPVTVKSFNIESSESISKPVTHRSIEEPREKSIEKLESQKDTVETSTVNALFRSIRPETLKQIEESIEKNNSPYQVTLTINNDERLIPTGGDLISKLIAHQGKETSTLNDKLHELEIIKSVDPEVHSTRELETAEANFPNVRDRPDIKNNYSNVESSDLEKKEQNMVSLLQLMSELLKLDRVPRPFSLSDTQSSEHRTRSQILHDVLSSTSSKILAKEVNTNMKLQNDAASRSQESSTESNSKDSVPRSKEKFLDQLAENLGEPIYRADQKAVLDLPEKQRSVDFQTVLPLKITGTNEGLSNVKTTLSTTARTTTTTTTTSTPKIVLTTEPEKTVVKTEFVPSIGFSLDTDEGREEYVEAVLGGLIEPQTAESEKKETIAKQKTKEETFSKRNETSGKI